MKKILIIHTGGTFGMVPQKPSQTLAPRQVQERITRHVPEIEDIAEIDFKVAFNIDSANIHPGHWRIMASMIFECLGKYDGFVIIHGTDSMSYTAAALSYMLQGLDRPVVITGSQRPLAEIRTDARSNLINAVELATRPIPEVCIFFDTFLFRGNRTVKESSTDYGAFSSPNYAPLAEIGLDIKLTGNHLVPHSTPKLFSATSDKVLVLRYFPGTHPGYLQGLAFGDVQGVIIEALGLGNLAVIEKSMLPAIETMIANGKLVVISSQCHQGFVDLNRYENGQLIAAAGAIGSGDMTTDAAVVKLMHLLGEHAGDIQTVRERMAMPIAGELTRD